MVTSSAQLSGASNSAVNHPGVHQASRGLHHIPNDPPNRSSAMPRPAPAPADEQRPQQQSVSSGPSVVSRYMLPTYRQANSSSSLTSPVSQQQSTSSNPAIHPLNASLPDILHSHMVPQIPRLRQNQRRQAGGGDHRHGRDRHRSEGDGSRHRHTHHGRGERRRTQSSSSHNHDSCSCKDPCVKCVVTFTSFRWVLVVLSILGVCCVVSGIVLAALHAAGSSFLFLAVMFIGLGILLVIVVSVGWKCTPRGHEPLHALFHIGQFTRGGSRDRHRRRRHRHRDGNWFGGVFYPEFQYRRPPPSYAASMQDYQNQSVQESSNNPHTSSSSRHERNDSLPGSPPPSYHSRTSTIHSGMNITVQGDSLPNSRPPTYRSRAPSRRPSLPRQESPSQQGTDAGDPSVPTTNDHHNEFLNIVVAGQNLTEGMVVGTDGAVGDTVSYSPTTELSMHQIQLSQHHDELDSSTTSSLPIPPNTTQTLPAGFSHITITSSQPGADENVIISANQNVPNVVDLPSDTRMTDSTVVVVTNQPVSSSSLPTTTTTHSMSFLSPTSHPSIHIVEDFDSDVQQLQQALEPLDVMDETVDGIDNLGANISSESTEHYDTHL